VRPLRLDLAGFAVFREETTVDFTDADFFALVGPTGSGKSTILDAICFALYGTVPRWHDPRSVANALAPSAAEARVRLVFETAGERYVATRVVRRDGKGRVKTAAAGLQRMPPGFDVRKLDTGMSPEDLGEVLAGTPSEMDAAVPAVLGLPYDQFVTCVVLPQGEFAEFLHAKPATRQQILVNLLGLSVYERVRERATARAGRAEAELAATDRLLVDLTEADDRAIADAEATLAAMATLAEAVEAGLPRLARAEADRAEADRRLAELDQQIAQLSRVSVPARVSAMAAAAADTRAGLAEATGAVTAAEDAEEKLRAEWDTAGDAGALRELLRAYEQHASLVTRRDQVAGTVTATQRGYDTAAAALAAVRDRSERADRALESARAAYARAQTEDQAGALRAHLTAGQPCPVCTQPVTAPPPVPQTSTLARARADGEAARAEADSARAALAEQDTAIRELDRALAAARAQADAVAARVAELEATLAGAPEPATLRRDLTAIATVERRLADAGTVVRRARENHRRAREAADAAEARLREGWRGFDTARDELAGYAPPAADRADLATAWAALVDWAHAEAGARRAARQAAADAVSAAAGAADAARAALADLFTGAGVEVPDNDGYARSATVGAERARAELERLRAVRAQADRLREQRTGHERDAQVARGLAQHLRANNFEAWLLEEALTRLVEGATAILRELSGGQYDLVLEGRDFYVVDHHDAGLRRPVRTLSGGETFQASLALALALSEQLAGMSTASASLESIVLDEGFGTLDAATLDAVAAALESLAARGDRLVGVVTHVPALADRIPVRFEVTKDARTARVSRLGW
jgi:exonuclease SbcC